MTLSFSFLIRIFISVLSLTRIASAFQSSKPFFIDVLLSDAFSGSTNCTDMNHWFLIEADIFIPQGSVNDIYLTVPDEFASFPNDSFPLKYNSDTIGSVKNNGSNVLIVSFEEVQTKNITATFNFLAKLTSQAKNEISAPGNVDYVFNVSTGLPFICSIKYVAKDISKLAANGGIYTENNTAWFTVDLPTSSLSQPVYFNSKGSSNTTYKFDTNLTSLEIVLSVDAFNQPLRTARFTAFKDISDPSQIKLFFNTKIDGGKYVRIRYFTQPLRSASIGNTVTLEQVTSSKDKLSKRDNAVTLSSKLYSGSEVNIQSQEIRDNTEPSQSSVIYSNVSTVNESYETYYVESKTESGIYTQIGTWLAISTLSNETTSSVTSSYSVGPSNVSSASTSTSTFVISSASHKEFNSSSISSLVSTSSIPSRANSSTLISSSTTSSTLTMQPTRSSQNKTNAAVAYLTYSVISKTINGQVVTFTSLYPLSTIASNSKSDTVESNSTTSIPTSSTLSGSYLTASSTENLSSFNVSTSSEPYQTYTVLTTTENGVETTYWSLCAVSTLKPDSTIENHTTNEKSTSYKSACDKTSCFTGTSDLSPKETVSLSRDSELMEYTSYTDTNSETGTDLLIEQPTIQTQLTSSEDSHSFVPLTMYQGGAASASVGVSGCLFVLALFWV